MYKMGAFNPQKIAETRLYAEALPDDASMPKQKILEICDKVDEEQQKILQSQLQAQLMQELINFYQKILMHKPKKYQKHKQK